MIIKIEIETIAQSTKAKAKVDDMGVKWSNKSNKDKCFQFMYIDTKNKVCDGIDSRSRFESIEGEEFDIDKFFILNL